MTEHDGKVTCAECLAGLLAASGNGARAGSGMALLVMWAALGYLLAWLVFYVAGTYLSGQPSEMHGI